VTTSASTSIAPGPLAGAGDDPGIEPVPQADRTLTAVDLAVLWGNLGIGLLVLVTGALIDRIGRAPALAGGLLVMAASTAGLLWFDTVVATAILLFGLGIGWNLSFVAATAQLADRTSPAERGKILGFNDLLSALLGAGLALLGGFALDSIGVAALAIGATAIVAAPILWLRPARTRPTPVRETT